MFSIYLLIAFYLFIINLETIKLKSYAISDKNHNINKASDSVNINIDCEECLHKNIFLPEYQNKYSRINELNDSNFNFMRIKNNRSVTLVPENLIEGNEKQMEIDKIAYLINNIEKNSSYLIIYKSKKCLLEIIQYQNSPIQMKII